MITRHFVRAFAIAAGIAGLLVAAPSSAKAQDWSWLWGGDTVVGGSGRQVVNFSSKHAPGQIIVSFGDRRLYYIQRRGQAISYPIAVPRSQSRWSGTTHVSMKRVNPSWVPTP